TAHPTRMGGWAKILINYSLERQQDGKGILHTPGPYKTKLISILIKEIPRFSNSLIYKSTTKNLIGNIFLINENRSTVHGYLTAWAEYLSSISSVTFGAQKYPKPLLSLGLNQDRVRLPFAPAQGTAHPTRMGGWAKILINYS